MKKRGMGSGEFDLDMTHIDKNKPRLRGEVAFNKRFNPYLINSGVSIMICTEDSLENHTAGAYLYAKKM